MNVVMRTISIVMATALVVVGSPSYAQQSPTESRVVMQKYVSCVVNGARTGREHTKLVAFLSVAPGTSEGHSAAMALIKPDCLRGTGTVTTYVSKLRFQPSLMRGDAFRALYIALREQPPRPVVRPDEIAGGWNIPADFPAAMLGRFGDCVVAHDPVSAESAVRAEVGSAAEDAAYKALMPALSGCLSQSDTLRFSRSVMEGALSEALYRRAAGVAERAPLSGPGAS